MSLDGIEPGFEETSELLRTAKAGDRASLARLLERYEERLLLRIRLLHGRTRGPSESGDLVQAVFVRVLENLDGFQPRDDRAFLRWMTQIARNELRMEARRPREQLLESIAEASGIWPSADSADEPAREAHRSELVTRITEALAELPPEHRTVIEYRHFEKLSFGEIGRLLGRSANAAQLLHARVILELRRRLETLDGD
jgi:RNA polymerase sigma-70 factor (ECF subfamily)